MLVDSLGFFFGVLLWGWLDIRGFLFSEVFLGFDVGLFVWFF